MKKILYAASAGLLCFFVSCSSKDSGAQKNLDAMHGIDKIFETGDASKIGDYIAADAVDHGDGSGTDIKGLDSIKASFAKWMAMTTDAKSEVVKELADDDWVMSWEKESGTMKTDGMGMKAGDKYSLNMIEVGKFKDGKATEHWSYMYNGDMMKMMAPPPTDNSKMMSDTSKKKM